MLEPSDLTDAQWQLLEQAGPHAHGPTHSRERARVRDA